MRAILALVLCLFVLTPVRADHVVLTVKDFEARLGTLPAAAALSVTGAGFRKGAVRETPAIRQLGLTLAALDAAKAGKLKLFAALPDDLVPHRDGFPVSWTQLLSGTSGIRFAADRKGFVRAFAPGRVPDAQGAEAALLDRAAARAGLRPAPLDRFLPALLNDHAFSRIAWQPHPLAPGHAVALREMDIAGRRALALIDPETGILLFPDHGVALILQGKGWRAALDAFVAAYLPPRRDWPRQALTTEARTLLTEAGTRHRPDGDYIADEALQPDDPVARLGLWPDKILRLDRRADGSIAYLDRDWRPIAPLAYASGPDRLYIAYGGGLTTATLAPRDGAPTTAFRGNVLTGPWFSLKSLGLGLALLVTGLIHLRPGTDATLRRAGLLAGAGALLFALGFWGEGRIGATIWLRFFTNFALMMEMAAILVAFRLSRDPKAPVNMLERIHVNLLGIAAGYLLILGLALGIAGSFTPQSVFF